jgi:hypothetical protein
MQIVVLLLIILGCEIFEMQAARKTVLAIYLSAHEPNNTVGSDEMHLMVLVKSWGIHGDVIILDHDSLVLTFVPRA